MRIFDDQCVRFTQQTKKRKQSEADRAAERQQPATARLALRLRGVVGRGDGRQVV